MFRIVSTKRWNDTNEVLVLSLKRLSETLEALDEERKRSRRRVAQLRDLDLCVLWAERSGE